MRREAHFDSSWPVGLVFALFGTFTLALTPTGQQLSEEILALPRVMNHAGPITPARPQVLMVTGDRQDQLTAAGAANPRGYHILVAETASAAREALQSHTDGIGVVIVDMQMANARRVVNLARSLAPSATLIRLPGGHRAVDISTALIGVI